MAPLRTPAQLGHPQFHCGKPPPAAEPRTLTSTGYREARPSDAVEVFLVGTNLSAHVDLYEGRRNPAHRNTSKAGKVRGQTRTLTSRAPRVKPGRSTRALYVLARLDSRETWGMPRSPVQRVISLGFLGAVT